MEALFFWFFSSAMIICGLAVVLSRNPLNGAFCFVGTIIFMAALFFMLSAFFLGWVEILVTAGAVMVLFLFIIMLLDLAKMEHMPRQKAWMGCALVLALGLIYLFAHTLNQTPLGFVTEESLPPISSHADKAVTQLGLAIPNTPDARDDTHQIGRLLFTRYVAPFEVTSLLILVATIGVIVLCKQDEPRRPSTHEEIVREEPPISPKKETALTP